MLHSDRSIFVHVHRACNHILNAYVLSAVALAPTLHTQPPLPSGSAVRAALLSGFPDRYGARLPAALSDLPTSIVRSYPCTHGKASQGHDKRPRPSPRARPRPRQRPIPRPGQDMTMQESGGQDRTGQNSKGHDESRPYMTGQGTTRQDKKRQDRHTERRHDRTRQDKIGQSKTRQASTGRDQTGQVETRQVKTRQERTRHDETRR